MNERDERSRQESDAERRRRYAQERRDSLQKRYPEEFSDGANRALKGIKRYPAKFLSWPLERRNAFFAGFNVGYMDRVKLGLAQPLSGGDDDDARDDAPDDGGEA